MKEKDQKFIAYWEEKQNKGRLKYAILHGIIFGILVSALVSVFSLFGSENSFKTGQILINLILLIIGGMFYEGEYTWWANSKRYKKLIQNSNR